MLSYLFSTKEVDGEDAPLTLGATGVNTPLMDADVRGSVFVHDLNPDAQTSRNLENGSTRL